MATIEEFCGLQLVFQTMNQPYSKIFCGLCEDGGGYCTYCSCRFGYREYIRGRYPTVFPAVTIPVILFPKTRALCMVTLYPIRE